MKVLLINGSPNENGCIYTALSEVAKELNLNGVETEIFWIGKGSIHGCIGCGKCRESGKCIFTDDAVNAAAEKAKTVDGFVFGSPVFYASINGAMSAFMDRLFYSASKYFAYKPGAAVVSARRAGTTAAYDQLNKYIGISKMIMVPAPYWNMVHGSKPEDVLQDKEGLYIMHSIGANMAWLIKALDCAAKADIKPDFIEPARTNFIR